MIRLSRLVRTALLIVVAAIFGASTRAAAQQPAGGSHTATLSVSSVDRLTDGTVVVTMLSGDDLAGVTTFQFRPAGNGSYDGEWAIEVAHAEFTDPATGIEPPDDDSIDPETGKPHVTQEYIRLVHRGAISGSIVGAQLTFDATGALTAFTAPLTVTDGSKEFLGVTGTGTASATASATATTATSPTASDPAARPATLGTLSLAF
jgi:hypothetical protein